MRQRMVFGLIFLSFMLAITPVARPSATSFTIDYPGALVTWPLGVNNAGTVVGYYADNAGIHGFVFQGAGSTGRYASVDVPGSIQTEIHGINNRGVTVGVFWDAQGNQHGFVHNGRDFTKGYTTVNVPFADCCTSVLLPTLPSPPRCPAPPKSTGSTGAARSWATTWIPRIPSTAL